MSDLLGPPQPSDAAVAFGSIHEQIPESGAALRDVLRSRSVLSEIEAFDLLDDVAKRDRDTHEKLIKRGLRAVLFSALFAGSAIVASMLLSYFNKPEMAVDIRRILTFGQFGALFLGVFMFGLDAKQGGNTSWKRARAQAEAHRLKQFQAVLEAEEVTDPKERAALLPLQLAFVRRYLWQAQLFYIEGKLAAAAQRRTRNQFGISWIRSGILVAAGLGVLLGFAELLAATNWTGPALGHVLDGEWVGIFEAFAGAIAVIALGSIAHRQGMEGFHHDRDASQRLLATQSVLAGLGGSWDEPSGPYLSAAEGAEAGDPEPVKAWLDAIIVVQESEHHEWLDEMERAVPASTDAWAIWRILQPD